MPVLIADLSWTLLIDGLQFGNGVAAVPKLASYQEVCHEERQRQQQQQQVGQVVIHVHQPDPAQPMQAANPLEQAEAKQRRL